jgi:hypothetical protein
VCPGTLPQRSFDLLELPVIQLRLAPRAARAAQGGGAALPPFGAPAAYALAAHLQFPGDLRLGPLASGEEAGGSFSPLFQTCKISSGRDRRVHALVLLGSGQSVNILCDTFHYEYWQKLRFYGTRTIFSFLRRLDRFAQEIEKTAHVAFDVVEAFIGWNAPRLKPNRKPSS